MVRPSCHHLLLLLLPLCLDASLALPILADAADDNGREWPLMMMSPQLASASNNSVQEAPWLRMMLQPRLNPSVTAKSSHNPRWLGSLLGEGLPRTQASQEPAWPRDAQGSERRHMLRGSRTPQEGHRGARGPASAAARPKKPSQLTKRSESGKIPTMGLGVLSDLRKFFSELRTNLDSVEEVAALNHDQGLNINPEDFLALLAQHEARLESRKGGSEQLPPSPPQYNKLMFGYTPDDQPYAHSGLGK